MTTMVVLITAVASVILVIDFLFLMQITIAMAAVLRWLWIISIKKTGRPLCTVQNLQHPAPVLRLAHTFSLGSRKRRPRLTMPVLIFPQLSPDKWFPCQLLGCPV